MSCKNSKHYHTAGLDTIFIQIYMDAPPGVPGVSKEQEGHKDQYIDVSNILIGYLFDNSLLIITEKSTLIPFQTDRAISNQPKKLSYTIECVLPH